MRIVRCRGDHRGVPAQYRDRKDRQTSLHAPARERLAQVLQGDSLDSSSLARVLERLGGVLPVTRLVVVS